MDSSRSENRFSNGKECSCTDGTSNVTNLKVIISKLKIERIEKKEIWKYRKSDQSIKLKSELTNLWHARKCPLPNLKTFI